MTTQVLWEGIEYHSLEYAVIVTNSRGIIITSSIVGMYQGKKYRVDYIIQTNSRWETKRLELKSLVNNKAREFLITSNRGRDWTLNGKMIKRSESCLEVDISITPFTNSLPINRLKLRNKESQIINVVFVDVLEGRVRVAKQQYTKLSAHSYKFQNVPNDFDALLTINRRGLVKNYPGLFKSKFKI